MLIRIILIALLLAPVAGWVFYRPVRVLAPDWNGVICISDEICVEDLTSADEAEAIYDKALDFVNTSVGEIQSNPRTIFCSTTECFAAFGFHAPAKAKIVGIYGIVIGPDGWTDYYLRHEIIHHLQSERLGIIGQWLSPRWFKEGMAYSLSEEPKKLKEPWASYRNEFDSWHQQVDHQRFWQEARQL